MKSNINLVNIYMTAIFGRKMEKVYYKQIFKSVSNPMFK